MIVSKTSCFRLVFEPFKGRQAEDVTTGGDSVAACEGS